MDESATRRKKIDPALYGVGWEQVPESEILTKQCASLSVMPSNKEVLE